MLPEISSKQLTPVAIAELTTSNAGSTISIFAIGNSQVGDS